MNPMDPESFNENEPAVIVANKTLYNILFVSLFRCAIFMAEKAKHHSLHFLAL